MSGYRLSRAADHDIESIANYTLEKWGINQVKSYIGGLVACCHDIARSDHIGRDASEFAENLFRFTYQSHIIFFIRQSNGILIVRVLHKSMDFKRHLGEI